MLKFLGKLFDSNQKEINRLSVLVTQINQEEEKVVKLKDENFKEETAILKSRLSEGQALDDLLSYAFALVREAASRTIGEKPYDVQMMAALTLHRGAVAEQKTGEGKTLSAIPALYLNALTGKGTHLVTVNDYLARRDCGWMGPIFHLLGLSVSAMIHDQSFIYDPDYIDKSATDWRLRNLRPAARKEAYLTDVTYGINSEFGFDYLRDNMVSDVSQLVQRGFHYAIVDEVDSVLIDEARTPHIISAPDTEPTRRYYDYAKIVERLSAETDFVIDEKLHTAHFTESGIGQIEKIMGVPNLYEKEFATVHHLEAALKAKTLFKSDKEYVVKDDQVIIVDEFTGRLLQGRRFSEGLHQAIEAKEGVTIQQESKTLATVSLQNYFRMYQKLAGMTGTAATEAEELHKIYNLDVVIIPTNQPMIRHDLPDLVYKTPRGKFNAVAQAISEIHKTGQPILVGTTSIEKNELLSELLQRNGVPHELLNAKNHEREATIITDAGKKGAVTVATNMAGRGVDIILGGAPPNKYLLEDKISQKEFNQLHSDWEKSHKEVVKLSGLFVIGTERHESRRIDNQLRGRSGRQGDPGTSRFYVALDDDIMRLFGGEQVAKLMTVFKLPEDVPLEHGMVTRAIEQAQVKVEGFHFDTRKHLVEYDDVLNKQREIIYGLRHEVVEGDNLKDMIVEKIKFQIENIANTYAAEGYSQDELTKVVAEFSDIIPFDPSSRQEIQKHLITAKTPDKITQLLSKIISDTYQAREKQLSEPVIRQVERWVCLSVVDNFWMDHLDAIDDLREGIGLRGYGQLDPLVEYKNEAFSMFERLVSSIDYEIAHRIFKVQVQLSPDQLSAVRREQQTKISGEAQRERQRQQTVSPAASTSQTKKKLGRNDPCPCGAINPETRRPYKYKKCGMINAPYHKG
ncbi:preprotein translocase subunit SecA [Candidatus Gottesmanbacteria bacterium RBG_16_38_7b]|uniref:Protein translocase subunit SecA n=2 Tax=Candidatus Gottesmaniibacteriota TaxID=1752720 RepID=A0A1F5YLG0_9BACT|nr:MAG: preprotein translocase subunit SecA [Candidatus Gottesmanbacteria bacterium RBG_16_38_7b]OGG31200.1 MAG: preprotein translocase subunit SecA [Candidatus Gottesmanbacteria bacterium RIFCSPLOWO2_02_FULL_38_8]